MRIQLLAAFFLYVNNAFALKGLKRNGSLRLLQDGPPVAGAPKEGAPNEGPANKTLTPKMDPKTGTVGADGVMPKDPKAKKCKKAKATPSPKSVPTERFILEGKATPVMEVEYCLHGDVTESECQAAKAGQVPKGHRSIKGDVEFDVRYKVDSKSKDVLNQVEQIFKSETAAEFIGCDNSRRRRADEATTNSTARNGDGRATEDLQVTGVDFTKLKTLGKGNGIF
jgi:hypothetical protein